MIDPKPTRGLKATIRSWVLTLLLILEMMDYGE